MNNTIINDINCINMRNALKIKQISKHPRLFIIFTIWHNYN